MSIDPCHIPKGCKKLDTDFYKYGVYFRSVFSPCGINTLFVRDAKDVKKFYPYLSTVHMIIPTPERELAEIENFVKIARSPPAVSKVFASNAFEGTVVYMYHANGTWFFGTSKKPFQHDAPILLGTDSKGKNYVLSERMITALGNYGIDPYADLDPDFAYAFILRDSEGFNFLSGSSVCDLIFLCTYDPYENTQTFTLPPELAEASLRTAISFSTEIGPDFSAPAFLEAAHHSEFGKTLFCDGSVLIIKSSKARDHDIVYTSLGHDHSFSLRGMLSDRPTLQKVTDIAKKYSEIASLNATLKRLSL